MYDMPKGVGENMIKIEYCLSCDKIILYNIW